MLNNSTLVTAHGTSTARLPARSNVPPGGPGAQLAGRKVHHRANPQNVLLDAAAQMTQAFSGRVQDRSVRERRVTLHGGLSGIPREVRHKALQHCKAGKSRDARAGAAEKEGEASGSPEDLARQLLSRPERIRQLTERHDDDPTAQYLALLEAVELLESGQVGADPNGVAVAAAHEVLEEMFAERGERILADINTFEAGSNLPPEAARRLRETYHDAVFGADSLGSTLKHLLDTVRAAGPGAGFREVHATLLAALGLDMAAARPSTDKSRLQALVSDLYHLEVIGTTVDGCDRLSGLLHKRHSIATFEGTALTSDLIGLAGERWVDNNHFKRVATRCGATDPLEAAVDFMTGVRDLLRNLPVKVFPTVEGRQTLLDAAQGALDDAIDREEGIIS